MPRGQVPQLGVPAHEEGIGAHGAQQEARAGQDRSGAGPD